MTEKEKIYEDLTLIESRAKIIFFLIAILILLLVFYYWKVQILDHKKYWALSEANRIRESVIPAPRGLITDRNGVIIADNAASFKASLIRENTQDSERSIRDIGRLLEIEGEVLKERIKKYESWPSFRPVVVKDNLGMEEVTKISSRKLELPELRVETEPKRFYPFGNLAAHVLGYMQEVSSEEMKENLYKGKSMGDLVGRTGVEKQYESSLVGKDGQLSEVIDNMGRSRGELERVDPKPGQDIELTLDFELQQKASTLLEGREGAIVILDPWNGEILALASYPTYDPNKFVTRFTPEEWMELVSRPDHPLENRAIRGLYAPGSIFKVTMALGALSAGVISADTVFFCGGTTLIYGRPFSCWFAGGHGGLSLGDGLRHSCNIYFYNIGRRMGIERIAEYAEALGFGKKTGIDLPGEKEGLVPSPAWSQKVRKTEWYPGETISVSIGQGPLLVTPVQIAVHTGLVAGRGKMPMPHLIRRLALSQGREKILSSDLSSGQNIKSSAYEQVIRGMWRSVNDGGTGRAARIEEFDVCGKTGSTQTISRERAEKLKAEIKTHSWFTGFAPRDNPRVVVTILVEYGGMGGATAAPLARELFELYKKKYQHDQ